MATLGTSLDFSKLPAAKTFAPSRDDILSTLGFFFGDPSHPEKLKDYSEAHAATCAPRQSARPPRAARAALAPRALTPPPSLPPVCADHFPDAFYGQNTRYAARSACAHASCIEFAMHAH